MIYQKLRKMLEVESIIASYDSSEETESERIAHGLTDIVDAAAEIKTLLEKIIQGKMHVTKESLTEIGVHLNHIQYHINDMKYFQIMIVNHHDSDD